VLQRNGSAEVERASETKIASSSSHKVQPAARGGTDHVIMIYEPLFLQTALQPRFLQSHATLIS
jgi:hypothetical protein